MLRRLHQIVLAAACGLFLFSPANAADFTGGYDTDGNGSIDRWCPSIDEDCDGFFLASSGLEGPASKGEATVGGTAQVDGAQTLVTTITVDPVHTFQPGLTAHFYNSVSGGFVDRTVTAVGATSISISGAAVTVTDNLAITSTQTSVNTIVVAQGHTFATGKIAHFYDSVSAGNVDRNVIATSPTSITVDGAAVTVTNALAVTSQVQYDCNNQDFSDYPGIVVDAGSGNVKTCLRTGSYGSSVAYSSYTCHSGSGGTYYLSATGTTTCNGVNAGTASNPWHPRCILDNSLTGYHTPAAGDCFLRAAGNYNFTWSSGTKQWDFGNIDGTAADPIRIINPKGYAVVDQNAGAFPVWQFTNSDNWLLQGFKIDGSAGAFKSGVGLYMTPANNFTVRNLDIGNIDGNAVPGGNNVSCLTLNGDASNNNIHHVYFHGCYDRDGTDYTNGNNRVFTAFEGTGNILADYIFIQKATTGAGSCAAYKHGESQGEFKADRGRVTDCYAQGWEFNQPNSRFKHLLIVDGSRSNGMSIRNYNVGGTPFYYNSVIEQFTLVGAGTGGGIDTVPGESSEPVGNPWLTIKNGIMQISRSSFAGDGTNAFYRIEHYADSAAYADHFSPVKKFILQGNFLYNPAGSAFLSSVAGNLSSSRLYTTLTAMQAAGWDSGSSIKNCSLDANTYIAGDAACYDNDWFWGNDTGGGGATTTTTTATTTTSSTSTTSASTTSATTTSATTTVAGTTNQGAAAAKEQ